MVHEHVLVQLVLGRIVGREIPGHHPDGGAVAVPPPGIFVGALVVADRHGDDVLLAVRRHADHLVRLIEVPVDLGRDPLRVLDVDAAALHEADLRRILHVEDRHRDAGVPVGRAGGEARARVRRIAADAHHELVPLADEAEHAHVAGEAVDLRGDLGVRGILVVDGVERIDLARRDGVGELVIRIEGAARDGLVGLTELERADANGRVAVGDVPGLELVLHEGAATAVARRPLLALEDAVVVALLRRGVVGVGHLELIGEVAIGVELGVQADVAGRIADVDHGDDGLLRAERGATRVRVVRDPAVGLPVLDDVQRVRGGREREAVEVAVDGAVVVAGLHAAALEDLELVDELRVLRVGDVEGVDPGLLLVRVDVAVPAPVVEPPAVVALRDVGDDVDRVVDLARHAFLELADDVDRLQHLRVREIRHVDGHELRGVVALELLAARVLREIERIADERVDGVAVDVHLDRVAVHRQARDARGVLRILEVVDHEAAVGVEVEEAVLIDAVDVRLFDRARAAVRCGGRAGRRGLAAVIGAAGRRRAAELTAAAAGVVGLLRHEVDGARLELGRA